MKKLLLPFLAFCFCLASSSSSFAATWFVRADGGSRYVPSIAAGQCDGLADAAYPGDGVNQHCAFNDYRSLWDDRNSYGVVKWVIAGGDTVILDNTKQWRVGFDQGSNANDAWCFGGNGTFSCSNPTIPAGTASQHTRILGRNAGACNVGNAPDPSKMTQIFGGFGVWTALNLTGTSYVDVECIEITSHATCIVHGMPAFPRGCNNSYPSIDDFDSEGIQTDSNTHDLLLQDLYVHGHPDRGIKGAIGGLVTANRIDISTNGMAGWDFDDGNGTPSINATLNFTNSVIEFSGCNSVWPSPLPVSCYSQSTGGYGDGIGTPAGMGMNVNLDHSTFRYNTQDGEDFGHIDTGSSTLSITNSISYGNNGGQFKWGPAFSKVTFTNNLVVGNCLRMSQPLPGIPASYNANLSDFCRAYDTLSFNFYQNATALFANNTVISYAPTTYDMACNDSTSCSNVVFTFANNVTLSYGNTTTYNLGGQAGGAGGFCGAGCNGSSLPIGTFNRSNNIFFGLRGECIANTPQANAAAGSATGELCANPAFVNQPSGNGGSFNEAELDGFNFNLSEGSPTIGAGILIPTVLTDFLGQTRPAHPTLGAIEFAPVAAAPPIVAPAAPIAPPAAPSAPAAPTHNPPPPSAPPVFSNPTTPTTPAASSLNIAFSAPHAKARQLVKLQATVAPHTGTVTPTGSVTFKLGQVTVGPVKLVKGALSLTVPGVTEHLAITATYSGDNRYAASTAVLAAE